MSHIASRNQKSTNQSTSIETTLIELNQSSADKVEQNGIYHCTLPTPVIVTEGTQLSIRMAIISSPNRDQQTTIIDNDETVAISYSYYDVDYSKDDKTVLDKSVAWPNPTFDYFAAYNTQDIQTITDIIVKLNGYYLLPNKAGGSYIVGNPVIGEAWSNIDPLIGCVLTFSYIDPSGNLGLLDATVDNVVQYPNQNPSPTDPPQYLYGMATGAQMSARYGKTLADGEFLCIPLNKTKTGRGTYPVVRAGSLNLVGVAGGVAGGVISQEKPISYTFPSQVSDDPFSSPTAGANIPGTGASQPCFFDRNKDGKVNEPLKVNYFSLVKVEGSTTGGTNKLFISSTAIKLDSGRYDNKALAVKLTQQLSDSQGLLPPLDGSTNQIYAPNNPLIALTSDPRNPDLFFRKIDFCQNDFSQGQFSISFNNTNSYKYHDIPTNAPVGYIIGAQQFAIEFGNAGDAFQLSYAHTPFQEDGHPNQQMVGIFQTGAGTAGDPYRFHEVTSATGIVIHDLQPRSLWNDQMNISNRLLVPLNYDASGIEYYERDVFLDRITYGFLGLDGFPIPPGGGSFRKQDATITNDPTYLDVTGDSRAIIGDTPVRDIDGGVFYIELINIFRRQGSYIDSFEDRRQISAVVSTQYENADLVTGYADSGIPYIHKGTPYAITECYVRILQGANKTPVPNLGGQNVVFIQIDRPLTITTD